MPEVTTMRDRITFRKVAESDTPFLCALYASTRADELAVAPWPEEQKAIFLQQQFQAQSWHYAEHYDPEQFLIIEQDGAPIGRLYLYRQPQDTEIIDIAIVPELRGKGIGSILLKEILDEATQRDASVTIYVEHFNPARHLYDRLGFQQVDTTGVYDKMKWRAAVPA
jgi:RimJ/RimL family protein N-acetyltransferase